MNLNRKDYTKAIKEIWSYCSTENSRVFPLTFLSLSNHNPPPSPPLSFSYCPKMNATMLQLSLCARLTVQAKFPLFKFTEICRVTPAEDLPSCTFSCWETNLLVLKPMFLNFQEQKRIVALNIDCLWLESHITHRQLETLNTNWAAPLIS